MFEFRTRIDRIKYIAENTPPEGLRIIETADLEKLLDVVRKADRLIAWYEAGWVAEDLALPFKELSDELAEIGLGGPKKEG